MRCWLLLATLWAAPAPADIQIYGPDDVQRQLDLATTLSTTAPWHETQAVLDDLKPYLDHATAQQRAELAWLEARNLALAGDMVASLEAAETLLEQPLEPPLRLRTYRLAANAAILARRFEDTFVHLGDGLRLLENPDLRSDGEGLYSLAAYAYSLVGELERGLHFAETALSLARQGGDKRAVCTASQRLAFVHKQLGNKDDSLQHYQQALDHCQAAGDGLITGIVQYGLGDLKAKTGREDEAAVLFKLALESLTAFDFETGLAEARLYYARMEYARENFDHAAELLERTLEPLADSEVWDYLSEAHAMLGSIARVRGDHDKAFDHHDRMVAALARAHDQERSRRITYLEVEFNLLHNQQQIALLEEQARVRELQETASLQRQRIRNLGYVTAGLFVLLLILLLVHTSRERRRYRRLSRFDGLTGALNHNRFFEVAEQELAAARQQGKTFWLLLADIDHFKQVNDSHGHAVGDRILRRVGQRLRECFEQHGSIGRIGGEEFAITLCGKQQADVEQLLDQFRAMLNEAADDNCPVTMSFGLSTSRETGDSLQSIRQRADEALYEAKRSGRNRIVYRNGD